MNGHEPSIACALGCVGVGHYCGVVIAEHRAGMVAWSIRLWLLSVRAVLLLPSAYLRPAIGLRPTLSRLSTACLSGAGPIGRRARATGAGLLCWGVCVPAEQAGA